MKKPPPGTEERIAKMTFASIYPLYVAKVEKKGRKVSKQGMQKLDRLATEILKELIVENPQLKVYT